MSRFVVALFAAATLAGCATKSDVDALKKEVADLKAEVEQVKKAPAAAPGGKQAAAAADPAKVEAAQKLMTEVQDAMKAGNYDVAKQKASDLSQNYNDTPAGRAASRMLPEITLVGSAAKDVDVDKWYQGKSDISQGKATLFVFWETWCPHCKNEMPKMEPFYQKHKAEGLNVIALTKVTKSSTDEAVDAFIKENKLTFPVGKEKDGSMSQAYAVTGIPAAAIVKDGKVVWRGHPARITDEMIKQYL